MKKVVFVFLSIVCTATVSRGAALDLSTWSPVVVDFAGNQPAASWALQPGNTSVIQTVNADPSFFLNNLNQTSFSIDGTWQAGNDGDDDFMGFVFGYQNSSNFYMFDWKQGTQSNGGGNASEGMTVKKYTGATGNGLVDHSIATFWENQANKPGMTILAQNHSSTAGWVDNVAYNFHLDFNLVPGQFNIVVKQGATELWNTTVNDATYASGQFGFYNFSQSDVKYAGFEQTGGVVVGVPDSGNVVALLAIGLAGLAIGRGRGLRRKTSK